MKSALYARADVPEYWIVNIVDAAVEVHREPDVSAGRYRTLVILRTGDVLSSPVLPGFSLDATAIMGD